MPLHLDVDADEWRKHLDETVDRFPGLVPVAKGNGYGFGIARLAEEGARLQQHSPAVDTLAVGDPAEVALAAAFPGDVLVLAPWDGQPDAASRTTSSVVRTIASLDALEELTQARTPSRVALVVELLTSMHRFGLRPQDLGELATVLHRTDGSGDNVDLRGFALHLPLDRPSGVDPVGEVEAWLERLRQVDLPVAQLWVSHLQPDELDRLVERHPEVRFRPRVGTGLWLGCREALTVRGDVLAVHRLTKGERFGYRQRAAGGEGWLVVVSGGTAHGVGLEAPRGARSLRARLSGLVRSAQVAAGRSRSPFRWEGAAVEFAEPPHMQVSMLWLPGGQRPPQPGDSLAAVVRHTTTLVDDVRWV
ncbi:MAG: alanine racemase [Actinomycetes bacterium]